MYEPGNVSKLLITGSPLNLCALCISLLDPVILKWIFKSSSPTKNKSSNVVIMVNSVHEMVRESFRYEDLVKFVFGLNSLDLEIYETLLLHGSLTAEGLGDIVEREKNTVHYSLQSLMACGVTYRRKKSIESGGYYYEYIPVESAKVKQVLKKDIDDWYYQMNELIEDTSPK